MLRLDLSSAMLGINNRNLEDFTVDLDNTRAIMQSPAGQEVGSVFGPCCRFLHNRVLLPQAPPKTLTDAQSLAAMLRRLNTGWGM